MQALVALTCFDSPLDAAWQAAQIESMTGSERTRVARIHRTQRREQFVVGHILLRRLLATAGFAGAAIEVDANGRAHTTHTTEPCHVSLAHSSGGVAAVVAPEPVGIDLEAKRELRDPRAAAAWLGLADAGEVQSERVLNAWVAAEACFKAGRETRPPVWRTCWQTYMIAVAGLAMPPQTLLFDPMGGIYNQIELRWTS